MNPLPRPNTPRPSTALRLAFIHAQWHADIVQNGRDGVLAELARAGVTAAQEDVIAVPGAFEIPLHAQALSPG